MSDAVKAASPGTPTPLLTTPSSTTGAAGSSANGSSTGSTILLQTPPPAISALNAGQIIRAVAAGHTADGTTLLDTRFGQIALNLPVAVVSGQVLRLQILRSGMPLEFALLTTPDHADRDSVRPTAPDSATLRAPPPSGPATPFGNARQIIPLRNPPPAIAALNAGQIIRAVVTGHTADGRTLLDSRFGQIDLNLRTAHFPGQALRLQIVRSGAALEFLLLPQPDGEEDGLRQIDFRQLRPGSELRGRHSPVPPASNPGSGLRGTGHVAADAGTRLNLRVLAIGTPGKGVLAATPDELMLSGSVSGTTRGGTLVQTATGTLFLPGVVNAPKGALITLQILGTPGTILPMTPAGAQAQSIATLSHGWPALQEAINVVHHADPPHAGTIVADSVPTTGPRLAAGLGFFLHAIFGARLQDWLGRDMQQILDTQRRDDLLVRLTDDFGQFSRLAGETIGSDWRAVMVPLMHDGLLHQIRLYLRAHDESGSDHNSNEEDAGTRFVVEVELSRLGALQLDGLVRPHRFDLMVRTHQPLPPYMRDEIGELFTVANEQMKATGQIAFQVAREFSVAPLETVSGHTVGLFA